MNGQVMFHLGDPSRWFKTIKFSQVRLRKMVLCVIILGDWFINVRIQRVLFMDKKYWLICFFLIWTTLFCFQGISSWGDIQAIIPYIPAKFWSKCWCRIMIQLLVCYNFIGFFPEYYCIVNIAHQASWYYIEYSCCLEYCKVVYKEDIFIP